MNKQTSFSFAFWARRRTVGKRMMVLWHHSPHSNLHIGFRENDAFVFSFSNDGWDSPNGLQTNKTYPGDLNVWVHWAGTYDKATGSRIIYRNNALVASDVNNDGYLGGDTNLHISSGSLNHPSWTNGAFHGALDDIYVLTRALPRAEIAMIIRDLRLARNDSLALHFSFEQPFLRTGSNVTVTDSSHWDNNSQLHGNGSQTRPHLYEDVVPVYVTCPTSTHGPSPDICLAKLDYWQDGFCASAVGVDIEETSAMRLFAMGVDMPESAAMGLFTLPADYKYPPPNSDPVLENIKKQCTLWCQKNSAVAATGCELQLTATSAACYGHTDQSAKPSGDFATGGVQYCWTSKSILDLSDYALVVSPTSCEAAGYSSITSYEECETAAQSLGLSYAALGYEVLEPDNGGEWWRKKACFYHPWGGLKWNDGPKAGGGMMNRPCNSDGFAGCLCSTGSTAAKVLNLPDAATGTFPGPGKSF